jgi:hypothetical protein
MLEDGFTEFTRNSIEMLLPKNEWKTFENIFKLSSVSFSSVQQNRPLPSNLCFLTAGLSKYCVFEDKGA